MTGDWHERVDDLLLAGEQLRDQVATGDARLVLTSHRLLVFRAAADPRFRAVELPNVLDVESVVRGDGRPLTIAIQAALLGVVAAGAGVVLPDRLIDPPAVTPPPGLGLDGVFATLFTVLRLVSWLDEALLALGAGGLVVAAVAAAWYAVSRERRVVIHVSGDDDVALPDADREAVGALLGATD
ncbi:MAG: hypothetical protein ABEJ23_05675 [Haloarculaceae archaeon]